MKKIIFWVFLLGLVAIGFFNMFLLARDAAGEERNVWDGVALRVDDGPARYAAAHMETIRQLGIKEVQYNIIGENLRINGKIDLKKAAMLAEMVRRGYAIGNHTYTHPRLSSPSVKMYYSVNVFAWTAQIRKTQLSIDEALASQKMPAYRCELLAVPEGAKISDTMKRIVAENKLSIAPMWDIDTRDSIRGTKRLTPEAVASIIRSRQAKGQKTILLIHDQYDWSADLRKIDALLRLNKKRL